MDIRKKIKYFGELGEKGATMVEFALIGFVLFLILVMGADLARASYQSHLIQYVTNTVSRLAILGSIPGYGHLDRRAALRELVLDTSNDIGLQLDDSAEFSVCRNFSALPSGVVCTSCNIITDNACAGLNPGGSSEFVYFELSQPTTILFSGVNVTLSAGVATKNEGF